MAIVTKCTGGMKQVTTVSTVHPRNDRNIQVWEFSGSAQPTKDATVTLTPSVWLKFSRELLNSLRSTSYFTLWFTAATRGFHSCLDRLLALFRPGLLSLSSVFVSYLFSWNGASNMDIIRKYKECGSISLWVGLQWILVSSIRLC